MNRQDQGFDQEDGNVFPKVSSKTIEKMMRILFAVFVRTLRVANTLRSARKLLKPNQ